MSTLMQTQGVRHWVTVRWPEGWGFWSSGQSYWVRLVLYLQRLVFCGYKSIDVLKLERKANINEIDLKALYNEAAKQK